LVAEFFNSLGWEWMIALTRHVTQRVVAMLPVRHNLNFLNLVRDQGDRRFWSAALSGVGDFVAVKSSKINKGISSRKMQ
jgi:hypothetical protein